MLGVWDFRLYPVPLTGTLTEPSWRLLHSSRLLDLLGRVLFEHPPGSGLLSVVEPCFRVGVYIRVCFFDGSYLGTLRQHAIQLALAWSSTGSLPACDYFLFPFNWSQLVTQRQHAIQLA